MLSKSELKFALDLTLSENRELVDRCLSTASENVKLKSRLDSLEKLVSDMLMFMNADGCEGCVFKSSCNDGKLDKCAEVVVFNKRANDIGIKSIQSYENNI